MGACCSSDDQEPASGAAAVPAAALKRRAYIVGVDYTDNKMGWTTLNGTSNDARVMKNGLLKFGFQESDITLLIKKEDTTVAAIRAALDDLEKVADQDTVVFFGFSGHGKKTVDEDGDEADGMDEAICGNDGLILDDEVEPKLHNIAAKARDAWFLFDCCYAGGHLTRSALPPGFCFMGATLEEEKAEDGIYPVDSPRGVSYNYQALFVQWFDKAMKEIDPGNVTYKEFFDKIVSFRRNDRKQRPVMACTTPHAQVLLYKPPSGSSPAPVDSV